MKVAFKFIEPKVNVTANYIENVTKKVNTLLGNSYISSSIEKNVWSLMKITQLDNFKKTTSATLHLKQTFDVTYLDVQISSSYSSVQFDIAAITAAAVKEFNEADPVANEMKIIIKNSLINDWKKCVWIYDNDALIYSKELYAEIYSLENAIRQFIDELLTRKIGTSWWDSYVKSKTKDKSKYTRASYIELAPFFNNINLNLMSIDIDDLRKIINTGRDYNKVQSESINKNLWKDIFSNYFTEDISSTLETFGDYRNHVVHNKLIDIVAYTKIKKNIGEVSNKLTVAKEKYNEEIRGDY